MDFASLSAAPRLHDAPYPVWTSFRWIFKGNEIRVISRKETENDKGTPELRRLLTQVQLWRGERACRRFTSQVLIKPYPQACRTSRERRRDSRARNA